MKVRLGHKSFEETVSVSSLLSLHPYHPKLPIIDGGDLEADNDTVNEFHGLRIYQVFQHF